MGLLVELHFGQLAGCCLLGAFAKFRKTTQLPHVCPSDRMEQLGFLWTAFH